eukprot:TRINITY_DN2441_c0_g1_i2.p1 TRINITY_DN2441_c0_g1~~TRINITY_DN2441_c0_g1_i2.p1  ORF type:complete len:518 (-),score=94.82 TRINITY_DN2441_c0_g1_i2:652-2205(-)
MSAPTSSAPPNAAAAPAAQQSNAPSSGASSLANEVVSISEIRNFSRRVLGELLDSVRGKKALVLDQKLSGPLGLVAEVSMLKEHGVEKIYLLNNEMLDTESKNVFYIIRPKIHHTKLIAQHIHHQRKSDPTKTYTITFVPRRTMICENVLEEEGVYGDVSILEYPLDLIPFDDDILSLEMDTTYRECVLDGDKTSLFYVAQSLMKMQSLFGIIPNVKGKGHSAKLVLDMMLRMRKEMGSSEPTNPPEIDTLILIDREADLVTPMMTQLTYEGLIDEVFRISNGFVDMEPDDLGVQAKPGQKKVKIPLNSNDKLYSEIRDLNFSKVGPELNKKAREINANYQERHSAQTVSQIRDFMKKLTSLKQEHQSLGLHTAIAEKILAVTKENNFHAKIEQEQAIVSGNDPVVEFLEDCVHRQEPLTKVLRLLCLYSLVSNGLKQKFFDQIRRDILQVNASIKSSFSCLILNRGHRRCTRCDFHTDHTLPCSLCGIWTNFSVKKRDRTILFNPQLDYLFSVNCV